MTAQDEAIKKLSKLKVGALFMSMGTGKTKVALDLISSKIKKVDFVLWVCPCSLKNEIEAERQKWHSELNIEVVGVESIGSSDRTYLRLLDKLQNCKSFIVVDESLKIKNISAKRTKRLIELGSYSTYKLILNGTPISKNALDLYTQMQFLSPKILKMSYGEFKDTYCEYYTRGKLKGKVRAIHNIPHLVSLIAPYVFESKLSLGVGKNYKSEYYETDMANYAEYKNAIFEEYYDSYKDDLNFNAFALKLQKYYTKHSDRQDVIDDIVNSNDEQYIVFVRFLDNIPPNVHKIVGDMNTKERNETIKQFKNKEFKVLYITYGCGSFGLNLQFCKNIIFAEMMWDYALKEQAEARIYRTGQDNDVTYYNLYCSGVGLEELISNNIIRKSCLLDEVKKEISKTKGGVKKWVKSL